MLLSPPGEPRSPTDTRPRFPGAPRGAPASSRTFPLPRPGASPPRGWTRSLLLGSAPSRPGPSLPGPGRPAAARGAGVCSARAPHTHHPGPRRLTHVSRRHLKAPRPKAGAAELIKAPAALRGGPGSGPTLWARPQLLYAPETSPPARGPASLRDDANTQSRRRPAPWAGAGPVPAEHVGRALPSGARGAGGRRTWGGVWLHLVLACRRAVAPRAGSHPLGHFVTKT